MAFCSLTTANSNFALPCTRSMIPAPPQQREWVTGYEGLPQAWPDTLRECHLAHSLCLLPCDGQRFPLCIWILGVMVDLNLRPSTC